MTKNTAIVVGVIVVLVGLGWWFFTQSQKSQAPAPQPTPGVSQTAPSATESGQMGEVTEIKVSGSEFSFSPANLVIKQGEKVRITFQNDGQFPHNLTVDELGIATKTINPQQSDTVEFTADRTGAFAMYCSVDQHRQKGMEGKVQLQ